MKKSKKKKLKKELSNSWVLYCTKEMADAIREGAFKALLEKINEDIKNDKRENTSSIS